MSQPPSTGVQHLNARSHPDRSDGPLIFYLTLTFSFLIAVIFRIRYTGWSPAETKGRWVDNPRWRKRGKGSFESPYIYEREVVKPAQFRWSDVAWGNVVITALIAVGVATFLWLFVALIVCKTTAAPVSQGTVQLSALATKDSMTGRFFLGSGTVKDEPMFSYITNDNGAHKLYQVPADSSTIYEGSDDAYLEMFIQRLDPAVWGPLPIELHQTYRFHIPAGSIVSDYTVSAG